MNAFPEFTVDLWLNLRPEVGAKIRHRWCRSASGRGKERGEWLLYEQCMPSQVYPHGVHAEDIGPVQEHVAEQLIEPERNVLCRIEHSLDVD